MKGRILPAIWALFFVFALAGCEEEEGECPEGQTMCPTGCADLKTDSNNCGQCGNKCEEGKVCIDGSCKPKEEVKCDPPCEEGLECCKVGEEAKCVNLKTDSENCGECGNKCEEGKECIDGRCEPKEKVCETKDDCKENEDCCEVEGKKKCIDVTSDPKNCGECGKTCPEDKPVCKEKQCEAEELKCDPACKENEKCCKVDDNKHQCVNITTTDNCGDCGVKCAADEECKEQADKTYKCEKKES
jgi:hypothetical protein